MMESVNKEKSRLSKEQRLLIWIPRGLALIALAVSMPFHIASGFAIPFMADGAGLWDNLWSLVMLVVFLGLVLGFAYPKVGGLLVTVPIFAGFFIGFIFTLAAPWTVILPAVAGVSYLLSMRILDEREEKGV